MKRITAFSLMLIFVFAIPYAMAQDLYEEIEKLAKEEFLNEAEPVVEAFGNGVNGGLFYTAKTHSALGFDVGLRVMMVFIPEDESALFDSAGVTMFPVPVIQGSLGLPMNFEVMVRGFAVKFEDETISLFGIGVKKDFKNLIPVPGFPHVSAMLAYHKFKASDIINSNHISFNIIASKKFMFIEPFVGIGMDRSSMNFKYTYVDETTLQEVPIDETVSVNTTRLKLGLGITPFPFVRVFGEYSFGTFPQATAGIVIGIR